MNVVLLAKKVSGDLNSYVPQAIISNLLEIINLLGEYIPESTKIEN